MSEILEQNQILGYENLPSLPVDEKNSPHSNTHSSDQEKALILWLLLRILSPRKILNNTGAQSTISNICIIMHAFYLFYLSIIKILCCYLFVKSSHRGSWIFFMSLEIQRSWQGRNISPQTRKLHQQIWKSEKLPPHKGHTSHKSYSPVLYPCCIFFSRFLFLHDQFLENHLHQFLAEPTK